MNHLHPGLPPKNPNNNTVVILKLLLALAAFYVFYRYVPTLAERWMMIW